MENIIGTYRKNIFFNPEQGMAAFLLRPSEGSVPKGISENGFVKVVGKYCLQQTGMPLSIDGEWKDTEYGKEFHIRYVTETVPTRIEAEEFIGDLGLMVSPRNIRKILDVSGNDIFAAAMDPDVEVSIIEDRHADPVSVTGTFQKIRALKKELDLFRFLMDYNGTYANCMKIMKQYPDNALEMLVKNPYEVAREASVPFKLVDQIALDNGFDRLSEERIQAIILWCIRRESNAGNVYMNLDQLYGSVSRSYREIPKTAVAAALKDHPYIKKDPDYKGDYYEAVMLKDEQAAATDFARLMETRKKLPFHPEYITKIEEERGFAFGGQQRQAFQLLTTTGFKLLTGDPGTGKTTTVNGLLRYLEMLWEELYGKKPVFALCAPSGRAAQRMKETTGRNALTIHKLIEYQPYGGNEYYKDANDPIEADVVVVDEVSMLGLSTFSKLIAAIKNGTLILLVGDVNQLQSVEPGNVLDDIVTSGCVDQCHLSEVFRQAEESLINVNAKKVMAGDEALLSGNDFHLVRCRPEETKEVLTQTVREFLEKYGDADAVQVLSPVRKGSCGVKESNVCIQEIFNPGKGGIWYGFKNYKLNDRVMMMSNNYSLQYYNGDVGYIKKVSDSCMDIEIGQEHISLPREQYGDMDLAYASTVHKSQGSEYDYLVIVLQEEAGGMLDRNLLYTAITRGKKEVCILYENGALEKAVRTMRTHKRNSHLAERIHRKLFQE